MCERIWFVVELMELPIVAQQCHQFAVCTLFSELCQDFVLTVAKISLLTYKTVAVVVVAGEKRQSRHNVHFVAALEL